MEHMSTVVRELTTICKFPEKAAWSLATQVVDRIHKDSMAAQAGVKQLTIHMDPVRVTATILFAMLRVQDVMREHILIGIKNHPAVTSEHVKFLATHSGCGDTAKMKDTTQELERVGDTGKAGPPAVEKSSKGAKKKTGTSDDG